MSRRDRDNSRQHHDQRGRSNERSSSHYSNSRNDGRSQFARPRHQQTSQAWQNGNYPQSSSYNSNYQYQNRPRPNRPGSSTYNHNAAWNQQWGGYNAPYQSPQWGLPNQQQVTSKSFTPHGQLPSYVTHQSQSQVIGLSQKPPTGNPKTSMASKSQSPPLGSKEYRERALEESKDRLKKSLRESLDLSSNLDGNDDSSGDQLAVTPPDASRSGPRPRTALVKTVRDPDKGGVGLDINSESVSQKQIRRSSSDSNNRSSSESVHLPKSSTSINQRSRSTSLSSSTNNASSGTCTANKQGLQSSVASKGQTSKEVQAAKQRVIKELLSMNRVKLKELVTYPRSRKIDMVMKYMIKESRVQQSHKQRQLAQAGMVGNLSESSNTLAQQDVEALLSDPDLHISLSNLPTEMIETLGNIFKLNTLGDVERVDPGLALGETSDGLGHSGMNEPSNIDISNEGPCLSLDASMKVEFKMDDVEMFHDVKPTVDLGLCPLNVESPDLCNPVSNVKFTSDDTHRPTDVDPSLDSEETSNSVHMILETQTDCSKVSMISSCSKDTFKKSSPIKETPITLHSTSMELTDAVDKPELLERRSPLSAISKVIPVSPTEPIGNFLIVPIQENTCSLTPESVNSNVMTPEEKSEVSLLPKPLQNIASVMPKEMHATPSFPHQFSSILEPLEVSEDNLVACNSQENAHTAYDNSQRLCLNSSIKTINTMPPNPFTEIYSSSETLENMPITLELSSSEQINMTPELNTDSFKTVSKHLESSMPSSIATNLSETYIALSESKAKITGTISGEGNSGGILELGGIGLHSEEEIVTTDPLKNVAIVSEDLVHDQVFKQPLDLPPARVSGMPEAELLNVKHRESVLECKGESTAPNHSSDVSMVVNLQPQHLEKITDDSDLSTPIISVDTTDCIPKPLRLSQDIASKEKGAMPELQEQTPGHEYIKSVSPEPVIMDQDRSSDAVEVHEQSALKTVQMAGEKTVLQEMGHKSMDPMCILYESLDVIGSRHPELQQPMDVIPKSTSECEPQSVSLVSDADSPDSGHIIAAKVGSDNKHECGILSQMEGIQVKSEREEIYIPTLYDHTRRNVNVVLPEPLSIPVTEVSTQTENSPNTVTNLTDMLQLFKVSCENPSQEAAFNQLKELFMSKTTNVNYSEPPTRSTRIKSIQQKRTTNSKRPNPAKKRHENISTSAQYSASQFCGFAVPNNLSDPILLDTTFSGVNQESAGLHTNLGNTSDSNEMGPQEKLKSLFHNITLIENKIETWMEIKKKLYEKVNNILEDEKSQCSSSSEQKDTNSNMVEVSSSSTEHAITGCTSQLHKPEAMKEVSTPKTRKRVEVSKSIPIQQTRTPSPREPRRIIKKPAASPDRTTNLDEKIGSYCITQSKVKKEILHSTSSSDESPLLSKSKSKRKSEFAQKKKKVIDSHVSLSSSINNDMLLTSVSPPLKRSSRNKSNLGEEIDKELPTTTQSEESDVRCSRRKVDKVPQVTVLVNKVVESLPRTSRRRIEKEIPVPAVVNMSEDDSPRTNRRTRRYQTDDTNEEPIELCILSPNLSRRTKGERKEILAPTELQTDPMADDGPSPRRATRQSISEPLIIQEFSEVKRVTKRKACEVENIEEPQSLSLLNTMRKCSVVIERLDLPLKKAKYTTLEHQSTVGLKEDSELSECEHQNESQMAEPNLGTDITSDEDDMPLFKMKQSINPNIAAGSSVTKFSNDPDQHSVSSSDTALDQGIDDFEVGGNSHFKSKKNKQKKSKKEKQYDHHSRNENLEFAEHNRGTILDIKIVGRHLLAASEDGFLYSYSMKSGKLKKKYEGHQAAVTCLCTIDGEKESEKSCPEKVITGSLDDHVRCFLFKSAELIHAPLKIGAALCVDYNWGIVYLGTKLGEVAKVNAKTFSLIGDHMKFSSESILALKATKEGPRKVLIIGTRDQPIAIRDADTGLFLRTVSGEWHHTVCSLLLDKSLVYCGTMSGPIPVFDFTNGQEMFRLQAGVGVRCIKIYNNLLFAGCYNGNIYIYNVKDHSLVQTISGSGKMVLCLDVTKNKVIYSCKDALKSMNFSPEVSRALKDAKLK